MAKQPLGLRDFHREIAAALGLPLENMVGVVLIVNANEFPTLDVRFQVPDSQIGAVLEAVKRYEWTPAR